MTERNEEYDEFLNEIYGMIEIGPSVFYPADIIFELEPITYRVGYADWESWRDEE